MNNKYTSFNKIYIYYIFIASMISIYAIFTRPLIFPLFIPNEIRVMVECIPFFLVIFLDRDSFKVCFFILFFLFLFLTINYLVNEATLKTSFLIFVKLSSFFIILNLLIKNKYLRDVTKRLSEIFWLIVSLSAILSFILYWIYPNLFSYLPIDVNDFGDGYEYFNNFYLGNIRLPYMFGMQVPKPSWYFIEAGPLSCFFMLNFIGSRYLIEEKDRRDLFKYCNLIAGLCTLSVTFYLCLFFIVLLHFFNKKRRSILIIISILTALFFGVVIFYLNEIILDFFQNSTSMYDRLSRFDLFLKLFSENFIQVLFIGLGAELQGLDISIGISSGWLSHIIERGILFALALFIFTIYMTKKNHLLMMVVLIFNISFEFFGYPIFVIMMAIFLSSGDFIKSRNQIAN